MIEVIVALIVQTGSILGILAGQHRKLNRIGADAKEARDQTANSHKTNLRDDLDGIKTDLGLVRADVRGIRKDISGLRRDDGQIRSDLADAIRERDARFDGITSEIKSLRLHVRSCPIDRAP